MKEKSIRSVVRGFGIRVRRVRKIRAGIFKIGAYGGASYSLKRMPMNRARLRWVDRALRVVRSHGYRRIIWRQPVRHQRRKAKAASRYVLSPWMNGRQPSPRSTKDMKACGVAIARFHAAGRTMARAVRVGRGQWQSEWRLQRRALQRAYEQARRGRISKPLNRLLLHYGPEMLRYADQSGRMLRRAASSRPTTAVLCHGDGGPSNFVRNARGIYILDFETLQLNHRAYDLYKIIYNSCKDHGWEFRTAKAILDGYGRIHKLNKQDYAVLKAWLRFPRTTYMVLLPGSRIPRTTGKLQWAIASERSVTRFLRQLDRYSASQSR